MRESKVEKALAEAVKACGGLCWKFTSPNLRGVPDRIVVTAWGKVLFVELKAPGKKPSPAQIERRKELEAVGAYWFLIDSVAEAKAFARKWCLL